MTMTMTLCVFVRRSPEADGRALGWAMTAKVRHAERCNYVSSFCQRRSVIPPSFVAFQFREHLWDEIAYI